MDDFLSRFLADLLSALLPVVASALAAWLIAQARLLWTRARVEQPAAVEVAEYLARLAVRAAEQAGAAQLIASKRDYALTLLEEWLETRGIRLDAHALAGLIEAAVYQEINRGKERLP